ncbi:UPF0178 protein [Intestinibaculum porci]|uniref:UPF0178 protein n=1 Tax=Intestinibaculum porci TaxID=2487118 RepID=A0A3G9JH40_9FIRM|nr:DUF188 domain-containing protein [Intestinibaculum porci]BBH25231.1 UPF0178 protein [Intestinibaculum porci]
MRLLIDGDGTPNIREIKEIAERYHVEMYVFCDYAHVIEDDYFTTIQCEVGKDAADSQLLNFAQADDLAITQDYGLASLLLIKGVDVLHVSGKRITEDNIETLLSSRYLAMKERQVKKHYKGPHKRREKEKWNFLKQVERRIIAHLFCKDYVKENENM